MKKLFYFFLAVPCMVMLGSCGDDETENVSGGDITKDNHEYVDLGLSVKWATCNVGAETPEEYGEYFAWGETKSKDYTSYTMQTYKWNTGKKNEERKYREFTKYCTRSDYGYNGFTDMKTVLEASDDAASANWGTPWRLPTKEECEELCEKCTWTWDGYRQGYIIKGPSGKTIFLPAAGCCGEGLDGVKEYGCYLSSSLNISDPECMYFIDFDSPEWWSGAAHKVHPEGGRYQGLPARPVRP